MSSIKFSIVAILVFLNISSLYPENGSWFKIKKLKGRVEVRHGVKEVWENLTQSDTLRPEDTILMNKDSYIEIEGNGIFFKAIGELILNISDLRRLSKDELLLQIAFEEMRALPGVKDEKRNSSSTGLYGADVSKEETKLKTMQSLAYLWVKGVRALFENGFYETASIRAKNLMSRYDELKESYELKLIVANSFEKLGLYGEAISEYNKIIASSRDENLKVKLTQKVKELKLKLTSAPQQEK
jgi:tetratricopeptide (TPR) repeat protein